MAATPLQTSYIKDLTVLKLKEYKEFKELLVANGIVKPEASTVLDAGTAAEICNALTESQASQTIDALTKLKPPTRSNAYAPARVAKTVAVLDDIESTISGWGFDGL
jgi:hypothetical protein